jgi:hypothetical protein
MPPHEPRPRPDDVMVATVAASRCTRGARRPISGRSACTSRERNPCVHWGSGWSGRRESNPRSQLGKPIEPPSSSGGSAKGLIRAVHRVHHVQPVCPNPSPMLPYGARRSSFDAWDAGPGMLTAVAATTGAHIEVLNGMFTKVFTNLGVRGEHPAAGPWVTVRLGIAREASSSGEHPPDPHPTRPTTDRWGVGPEGWSCRGGLARARFEVGRWAGVGS